MFLIVFVYMIINTALLQLATLVEPGSFPRKWIPETVFLCQLVADLKIPQIQPLKSWKMWAFESQSLFENLRSVLFGEFELLESHAEVISIKMTKNPCLFCILMT